MQRMSAADWRKQVGADEAEPENPYASNLAQAHSKMATSKVLDGAGSTGKNYGLPQPTEHEIQNAILDRLGFVNKGFFWRENSGLMKLENKGKERFFRAGTPGIPDIMGVFDGFPVGIEVKRPGKKQSLDQKAFQQRFDQCGGIYIVCTDSTQIINQIMAAIAMKKGE